jgi:flagellar hook assembly protein FlgD
MQPVLKATFVKTYGMKTLLAASIVLFVFANANAQTSLKFCVDIGKAGTCKTQTSEFKISKDGGTISFLLKSAVPLGVTDVNYKIYKLLDNGQEVYNSTINQKLDTAWTFAWEEAVFYDEGTYKVKVFDASGHETFLCSNILKIFMQ